MTLIDFNAPLTTTKQPGVSVQVAVPTIAVASTSRTHMMGGAWGWQELRDYVISQIERRFGPVPRDPLKEKGIFEGFINRWGSDKARAIAEAAFETHGGMWRSAPVSIYRFTMRNDAYFAEVIAASL